MPLDQDALIESYQQRVKGSDLSALQAGPAQNLAVGATTALFHIAMQLGQLNQNVQALTAAIQSTPPAAKATGAPAAAEPEKVPEPPAKSEEPKTGD